MDRFLVRHQRDLRGARNLYRELRDEVPAQTKKGKFMSKLSSVSFALLCSSSVLGLASAAFAQDNSAPVESVVVTGSRVISDISNSPTPLTVVSTEDLAKTTPTDISDALNKLPVFVGSSDLRTVGSASANSVGDVLNLRNFGAQRTLILFDGHRVVASNANGTTDIDTLPQMLMSRVDVVTGGASAVYGSDAVTGVVNFVLDKTYSGIKYEANGGEAGIGVGAHYEAGVAAGGDILGGRGHIEGSLRMYHADRVPQADLPYGSSYFVQTGLGTTAANPVVITPNGRISNSSLGGFIQSCGTGCAAAGQQFVAPGIIGPFSSGTATGSANAQSGGDGSYSPGNDASASLQQYESFGRFSYDLSDNANVYVQALASQSGNFNNFYSYDTEKAGVNSYFKNNPYLSAASQALLDTGAGNTFISDKFFAELPNVATRAVNRNLAVTTGADGNWKGFDWDLFYTHNENRLSVANLGNPDNSHMLASDDAVVAPAGVPGVTAGTIVCNVTITNPGLYPGCVPIDPFGPGATNRDAWSWLTQTTSFRETNVLDDLGGSISGTIFNLPAGPVKAALSTDVRWLSLQIDSNDTPAQTVDCTGLRLCQPNTTKWVYSVLSPVPMVSENVWEFGGELNAPLLKDLPLIEDLSLNLAGRYTDYSATGDVQTWKVGVDYRVTDDIRFRATTSVDIRAPTLNDLYGPVQTSSSGFLDLHTGVSGSTYVQQSGPNPSLVPEVARTYSAGVVLTPTFISNLLVSVDYYQIDLKNAISNVNGTSVVVENLCEGSAPAYNSPYCSLYVRPLPFSNTTAANFPTLVKSQSLNAAYSAISGLDIEADYKFDVADVISGVPGQLRIRELLGLQPVNEIQPFSGQPFTYTSQPKTRSTAMFDYALGDWDFSVLYRWISSYKLVQNYSTPYYNPARVPGQNYIDLTVSKNFDFAGTDDQLYLTVENVANNFGPIVGGSSTGPGYAYSVPSGYPVVGRTFTIGIRGNL